MNPGEYIQAMPKDELYQTLETDIAKKFEQFKSSDGNKGELWQQKVRNIKLRMENMEL